MSNIPEKCLLCGEGKKIFTQYTEGKIYQCPSCGVGFQYPQGKFDYSDYNEKHREDGREKRVQQYVLDISYLERFKNYGKILDVGCGAGTFLSLLSPEKYDKDGIDIRGAYKVGDFAEYEFDSTYDIVHIRGTIEHLSDPLVYIKKANKVLNMGGILAVTHIPNIDHYPKMKRLIMEDEHLFYFNVHSMCYLADTCGFKIRDIYYPFYGTPYEQDEQAHFMNILSVYAEKIYEV